MHVTVEPMPGRFKGYIVKLEKNGGGPAFHSESMVIRTFFCRPFVNDPAMQNEELERKEDEANTFAKTFAEFVEASYR